uniref:Uncharacterized protein n=1 Tax=Cacopsylla melanoneura TaxID=428564 RepID=A0A8D8ZFH3_9HEMI
MVSLEPDNDELDIEIAEEEEDFTNGSEVDGEVAGFVSGMSSCAPSSTSRTRISSSFLFTGSGRVLLFLLHARAKFPHTTPPDVSRLMGFSSSLVASILVLSSRIVSFRRSVREKVLCSFLDKGPPLEAGLAE